MRLILKNCFSILLSAYCLTISAQVRELPELTKEGLIADYRLAMDILKKQHPNPFKFIDSVTYNHKVDSLLKLAGQQDDVFAALQYSPVQLIRDVHTSLRFSDDNTREMISHINYFPFPIIIEKDKILVNIKGEAIPFAAEILSINGQSSEMIIESLISSSYSDGFITSGTDRVYSNFQTTWSLRHYTAKNYAIEFIEQKSKTKRKIILPSLKPSPGVHSSRLAVMPFNQLARSYWIYGSYDDDLQTGILTVNSFNLEEPYAYKEFSSFFKEVKKRRYKNVVIDIRNNGGGNPAISALLYSFLSTEDFRNVYNYRTKTIETSYAEFALSSGRKMSEEDVRNTRNFLYQRFDKDSLSGFYVGNARLKEGLLENFPPDKDAFPGDVYVLTGGGTVSAATYFASLVQKNKRGLIIGKETGSGETVTTAAWFMTYLLPNTKSVLTVPMSELFFFNAQSDNGRGVMPDKALPLNQFMIYLRAGRDPELTYATDIIRSGVEGR